MTKANENVFNENVKMAAEQLLGTIDNVNEIRDARSFHFAQRGKYGGLRNLYQRIERIALSLLEISRILRKEEPKNEFDDIDIAFFEDSEVDPEWKNRYAEFHSIKESCIDILKIEYQLSLEEAIQLRKIINSFIKE